MEPEQSKFEQAQAVLQQADAEVAAAQAAVDAAEQKIREILPLTGCAANIEPTIAAANKLELTTGNQLEQNLRAALQKLREAGATRDAADAEFEKQKQIDSIGLADVAEDIIDINTATAKTHDVVKGTLARLATRTAAATTLKAGDEVEVAMFDEIGGVRYRSYTNFSRGVLTTTPSRDDHGFVSKAYVFLTSNSMGNPVGFDHGYTPISFVTKIYAPGELDPSIPAGLDPRKVQCGDTVVTHYPDRAREERYQGSTRYPKSKDAVLATVTQTYEACEYGWPYAVDITTDRGEKHSKVPFTYIVSHHPYDCDTAAGGAAAAASTATPDGPDGPDGGGPPPYADGTLTTTRHPESPGALRKEDAVQAFCRVWSEGSSKYDWNAQKSEVAFPATVTSIKTTSMYCSVGGGGTSRSDSKARVAQYWATVKFESGKSQDIPINWITRSSIPRPPT